MPSKFMPRVFLASLMLSATLWSGCGYNDIQTKDENINNKWAEVETQLQRRADLIPNLVKVVKSYATHENTVFTNIANARARMSGAIQTHDPNQVSAAEGQFNGALSRLLVVAERYPDLKANEQYTRLMDELAGTENRIAVSRKDYNDSVSDYNTYIRQFPTSLTASVIHAHRHDYYKAPAANEPAPQVNM